MSTQTTLATLKLSATQQLRVTGSIQDRDHREAVGVDIRKFYKARGGDFAPTPKGIWLNLDQLKQLMIYLTAGSEGMNQLAWTPEQIEQMINPELLRFLQPNESGIERLR